MYLCRCIILPREECQSFGTELANGHMTSIAAAIITKNKQLADMLWRHFLKKMDQKCSILCDRCSPHSPFRTTTVDGFRTFRWKDFIDDLTQRAPILLIFLSAIVSHTDHQNERKTAYAYYSEPRNVWSAVPHLTDSTHAEKHVECSSLSH